MRSLLFLLALAVSAVAHGQQDYWHPVSSGTHKDLLSISFGSATTGYIGGRDSLLLKTTDGGQTWQQLSFNSLSPFISFYKDISDVDFVSDQVGYITVTDYDHPMFMGVVFRTQDGGNSWTPVDAGNTAAYSCYFFSEGNGFVTGSAFFAGGIVSKISNGSPADYHMLYGGPDYFIKAIDFLDTQQGIVGGADGKVFRTFNGGVSWDTVQTNTDSAIYGLTYLSDSVILATVNSDVASLLISHDAGASWNTDLSSATFDYPVLKAVISSAKDSFIAVGTSGTYPGKGTIYWHDGSFNRMATADRPLHAAAMLNDSIAYCVGDSGLIVTNRQDGITGIAVPGDPSGNMRLYPNPSTGVFVIELPVRYTLRVYDISGRLVLSRKQPALKQPIDLSGKAKGSYMVECNTGTQKICRKVILR